MDLQVWRPAVWAAFRAGALTRCGRDVLLTLATFRGRGGGIYPSHASVAQRVRCCVRTVRTALADARDACLVSWVSGRRRRTSNRYNLEMPQQTGAVRVPRRIERLAARAGRNLVGNWRSRGEHQTQKGFQGAKGCVAAVPMIDRAVAVTALATVTQRRRAEREAIWVRGRMARSGTLS